MSTSLLERPRPEPGPKPLTQGRQSIGILIALWSFVVIPFAALIAAVPVAWGGCRSWTDVGLALFFYVVPGLGVTMGFHRYLPRGAFKGRRPVRIALAVAGSLAIQG